MNIETVSEHARSLDARAERELDVVERVTQHRDFDERRKVVAVTLRDLLTRELPPPVMLLTPWLTTQSLTMIHAWRGIGKTHVALGIAYALASGGEFLNWRAEHAVPVMYLDGEMSGAKLKGRFAAIVEASDKESDENMLRIVTPDLQPDGITPDLGTVEGQDAVEAELGDAKVIIVDNISCLVRSGGKENDADSWSSVATWALRMRARGRAVVFIHHSGKGGLQRGTSKREDALDTVITLRRPTDYTPDQGARFEIQFEKGRELVGQDVRAIEARLETGRDGKQLWTIKDASHALHDRIVEMVDLGLKPEAIAQDLGCSRATVYRHVKDAKESGELTRSRGGET